MIRVINKVSLLLVITVSVLLFSSCASDIRDPYDIYIESINRISPNIVVYGDDISFKDSLEYTVVSKEEFHPQKDNYKTTFLIINDRSGSVIIEEDEYELILDLVGSEFVFIYIGESKLDKFQEKGFYRIIDEGIDWFAKYSDGETVMTMSGTPIDSDSNDISLSRSLIYFIQDYLQR